MTTKLTIANFNLQTKLGEGCSGKVYRANLIDQPSSLFAVKVAAHKKTTSEVSMLMFDNEIALHSMLDHPNIVKMVDYDVNGIMKKYPTKQE